MRKSEKDYKIRSNSHKILFNLLLLHKRQNNGFVKDTNSQTYAETATCMQTHLPQMCIVY